MFTEKNLIKVINNNNSNNNNNNIYEIEEELEIQV